MLGTVTKYRSWIILLMLFAIGTIFIGAANTFQHEWLKVRLDRLLAEIGALILVVGMLHWFFELGLRKEILRDVASTAAGSAHVHQCGLDTCILNARDVDERAHWAQSPNLTIGYLYSTGFFKEFHQVFRDRCRRGLQTTVAILRPDGAAARYLHEATTGGPNIRLYIADIIKLFQEIDPAGGGCRILFHDRVLRYSFIQTDENIWIKFYANSPDRTTVPAFKTRAGTPLHKFFADDIERVLEQCHERY